MSDAASPGTNTWRLGLWSLPGAGTSSLLSTLLIDRPPTWMDVASSRHDIGYRALEEVAARRRLGLPPRRGAGPVDVSIATTHGPVAFVDLRAPDAAEPSGVLYVIDACDIAAGVDAVRAARRPLAGRDGLVLAMADQLLHASHPGWRAAPSWWVSTIGRDEEVAVLESFEDRVWPASAFGYDEHGLPAVLLGKSGQMLPWRASPREVERPFLAVLGRMGFPL